MDAFSDFFPHLLVAAALLGAAVAWPLLAQRLRLPGPAAFLAVGIVVGLVGISPFDDLRDVAACSRSASSRSTRSCSRVGCRPGSGRFVTTRGPSCCLASPAPRRPRRASRWSGSLDWPGLGARDLRRRRARADRSGGRLCDAARRGGAEQRAHGTRRRVRVQRPGGHLVHGGRARRPRERRERRSARGRSASPRSSALAWSAASSGLHCCCWCCARPPASRTRCRRSRCWWAQSSSAQEQRPSMAAASSPSTSPASCSRTHGPSRTATRHAVPEALAGGGGAAAVRVARRGVRCPGRLGPPVAGGRVDARDGLRGAPADRVRVPRRVWTVPIREGARLVGWAQGRGPVAAGRLPGARRARRNRSTPNPSCWSRPPRR